MIRSYSNRVFGGVCGGLARRTPLNATIWRLLFIGLTLATQGVGILIYLIWWWMLPQESPFDRQSAVLPSLIALILSGGVIAAYIVRADLATETAQDLFWPLALLLLALVFLIRQFNTPRGNVLVGLVLVILPLLAILGALNVIPPGLFDIIGRGLPAVLIFFGLWLLLRDRLTGGSVIALVVSLVLVGGIAVYAFSSRVGERRTENQITVSEDIESDVSLIQVNVETLDSDVQFIARTDGERTISAFYEGSTEHALDNEYTDDDSGLATFTIRERRTSDYPLLESIGRGALRVEFPEDIAVSVSYAGDNGTLTFDMDELNLERLNLDLERGDALITLPEYQPLSPSVQENPGQWSVLDGNLTVRVPEDVGLRLVMSQQSNTLPLPGQNFNDLYFLVQVVGLNDWILQSQGYDAFDIQLSAVVNVPGGRVQVNRGTPTSEE